MPRTLSEGSTSSTIFFPLSSFTVSFILLVCVRALLPLLPLLPCLRGSPCVVVGGDGS